MRTAFDSFSSWWGVICWDHYSFERDGGWPAKGLSHHAYRFLILSLCWLHAGRPDNCHCGIILDLSFICLISMWGKHCLSGRLRSREAPQDDGVLPG